MCAAPAKWYTFTTISSLMGSFSILNILVVFPLFSQSSLFIDWVTWVWSPWCFPGTGSALGDFCCVSTLVVMMPIWELWGLQLMETLRRTESQAIGSSLEWTIFWHLCQIDRSHFEVPRVRISTYLFWREETIQSITGPKIIINLGTYASEIKGLACYRLPLHLRITRKARKY